MVWCVVWRYEMWYGVCDVEVCGVWRYVSVHIRWWVGVVVVKPVCSTDETVHCAQNINRAVGVRLFASCLLALQPPVSALILIHSCSPQYRHIQSTGHLQTYPIQPVWLQATPIRDGTALL